MVKRKTVAEFQSIVQIGWVGPTIIYYVLYITYFIYIYIERERESQLYNIYYMLHNIIIYVYIIYNWLYELRPFNIRASIYSFDRRYFWNTYNPHLQKRVFQWISKLYHFPNERCSFLSAFAPVKIRTLSLSEFSLRSLSIHRNENSSRNNCTHFDRHDSRICHAFQVRNVCHVLHSTGFCR